MKFEEWWKSRLAAWEHRRAETDRLREAQKDVSIAETMPLSYEGCEAFWKHWRENGETHKHGFYESTWGAIREYFLKAETTENHRAIDAARPPPPTPGEAE